MENEITVISNAEALDVMNRGEIDVQITTAKRYPRSIGGFKEMALSMACLDQETAESMFYSVPRGGKAIVGPSVRLAEIVISAWGNMRAGARIVGNDGKTITAQAMAHDLQTNVLITIEVKRRITNAKGERYNEDLQVVAGNAACAIALRNAVFKVIPMAFTKEIFEQAKKVAVGSALDVQTRRINAIEYFKKLGATEDRILLAVGKRKVDDIGVEELTVLLGIKTAIKDGDTTINEAFPNTMAEEKSNKVAETLKNVVADIAKKPEQPKVTVVKDTATEFSTVTHAVASEFPNSIVTTTESKEIIVVEAAKEMDPYSMESLQAMELEELKGLCVDNLIDYNFFEGKNTKKKLFTLIWECRNKMPYSINLIPSAPIAVDIKPLDNKKEVKSSDMVTRFDATTEQLKILSKSGVPDVKNDISSQISEVGPTGSRAFSEMRTVYAALDNNMYSNERIAIGIKTLGLSYTSKEDLARRAPKSDILNVLNNC